MFAPWSCCDDFALGRGWVSVDCPYVDCPYKDHLVRYVGGSYLAPEVVVIAAVRRWSSCSLIVAAPIASPATDVPHLADRLAHRDDRSAGDDAASIGGPLTALLKVSKHERSRRSRRSGGRRTRSPSLLL